MVGRRTVGVPQVGLSGVGRGQAGHLVHDGVRPGRGHRLADRGHIQAVHHDAIRAQLLEQAQLGLVRRRRRHLVAPGHQLRHQPLSQGPAPACHEHPMTITVLILVGSQPRDR